MTWSSTAREAFRAAFNGFPNVMTPTPVAYGRRRKCFWELSRGEGMRRGSELWGVTVLNPDGTPDHDRSRAFATAAAARAYIKSGFTLEDRA